MKGPDNRQWRVGRRWFPGLGNESVAARFHRRYRQWSRHGDVVDPGCGDFALEGLVAGIIVIVAVLVLVLVALPLVLAVVDLFIVIVLALLGVVGRVVLRRPWIVQARSREGTVVEWPVVGWRASGARVEEVARQLESGALRPPR